MPITYTVKSGGMLVHAEGFGIIANEDIVAYACLVAEDPSIQPGARELVDFRAVADTTVTREGLEHVVVHDKLYADKFTGWRCAIVAVSDQHYGWSKVFATLGEMMDAPAETQVFKSIDEACKWLGIQMEDLEAGKPPAA